MLCSRSLHQVAVVSNLRWLTEDPDLEDMESYGGDRQLAYDRCLQALANLDHDNRNLYRINAARASNTAFLEELGDQPSSDIVFVWSEADTQSWETLSKIVNAFGQPWRHPDVLEEKAKHFEIWELIRIFFLHAVCPENVDLINQTLVQDPVFKAFFQVTGYDGVSQDSNSSSEDHFEPLFDHLVIRKRGHHMTSSGVSV